ncbi:MAG: 50S ribosomal protein L10 [Erysipelotrichaceae bacterium]|nr:50S ribosomal protein L10 [Erysipelotrichaceae bacterium]
MNEKKIALKAQTVSDIGAVMDASQSFVVVEYRGLSVAKLTELRRSIAKQGGKLTVYKNGLVSRAAKERGYEMDDILVGPNAFVSCVDDPVSVPNLLVKFSKKAKQLVIKGGIVENKVLNADEMVKVANLPTKPQLISMFIGAIMSPVSKFAVACNEIAKAKENA